MSDLPRVDSVMGCESEHSNMTSRLDGQHKDPLVVVCPSLTASGTCVCHVFFLFLVTNVMSYSCPHINFIFIYLYIYCYYYICLF